MEREAFVCPFCGAPYDATLASGIVETKCKKCGNRFPIPSSLSGMQGQCVNHPGSEVVGLCSKCGQGVCERCLYVNGRGADSRYLCSSCIVEYVKWYYRSSKLLIVAGLVMFLVGISQMRPVDIMGTSIFSGLARYGIGASFVGLLVQFVRPRILSLEKRKIEDRKYQNLRWAECPKCKAGYFYNLRQIRPDWTVNCQNCDQIFKLKGTVPVE